jgi:hypothetical protein
MLAALVGAPVLVVLTLNMSIRPMIVTTGGLLLQHLLIGTCATAQLICAKPAVVIFLNLRRLGQFHTGFTLGPIALLLTMFGDWLERPLRSKTVDHWH